MNDFSWLYLAASLAMLVMLPYLYLYGEPASDMDRAELIYAAGNHEGAVALVRGVVGRKRLQRRHVRQAMKRVRHLVDADRAAAVVRQFKA